MQRPTLAAVGLMLALVGVSFPYLPGLYDKLLAFRYAGGVGTILYNRVPTDHDSVEVSGTGGKFYFPKSIRTQSSDYLMLLLPGALRDTLPKIRARAFSVGLIVDPTAFRIAAEPSILRPPGKMSWLWLVRAKEPGEQILAIEFDGVGAGASRDRGLPTRSAPQVVEILVVGLSGLPVQAEFWVRWSALVIGFFMTLPWLTAAVGSWLKRRNPR